MTAAQLLDLAGRARRRGNTKAMAEAAKATGATCYVISQREADRLKRDYGVNARALPNYHPEQEAGRHEPLLLDISVLEVIGQEWAEEVRLLRAQVEELRAELAEEVWNS